VYANASLAIGTSVAAGTAGISVSTSVTSNFGAVNGLAGILLTSIAPAQLPLIWRPVKVQSSYP
jgi:hypothetical protein